MPEQLPGKTALPRAGGVRANTPEATLEKYRELGADRLSVHELRVCATLTEGDERTRIARALDRRGAL